MLAVVGATGGFSSAASSILGATHSVTHFTAPPAPPTTRPGTTGGGRTSAGDEYAHAPTITGFSPAFGKVGTSVTVTGTNFAGPSQITSVTLNGTDAGYAINSSTSLTFTVPEGATSGTITVENSADSATSSDTFTVVVAPTITNLSPDTGGGGTDVVITGSGFTGSTKVTVNNISAPFTIASDSEIDTSVPANAPAKLGSIVVTNPAGVSNAHPFTVESGAPTVSTFTPTSGKVGDTITVKGTKFVNVSEVDFNGVPGDNVVVGPAPGTSLTVQVPTGATTGPITVVNDKGDGTSKASFLIIGTPVITSFKPTAAKVGVSVTITGQSFTGTTSVTFNGVAVTKKTIKNDTTLLATVPVGATTGSITVTNGVGSADSSDDFTVITAVPNLDPPNPTHGGFGTSVVLTGSDLAGVTAVAFNGKPATFTVVSDTEIDTAVPAGAPIGSGSTATGGIVVTNPIGKTKVIFNVDATGPTITKVGSTAGKVGDAVQITGTHLDTVTDVFFGAGDATAPFVAQTATGLTVVIPSGATTDLITVVNPGGQASSKTTFTILETPVIVGFTPAYGKPGTKVTIVGDHLIGSTRVDFGSPSASATPTFNKKDGSISAIVPKTAVSGPITVHVGSLESDSGNDHFTIVTKPTATGGPASAARGTQITITGTGLAGTTSVKVGALSAAYSVVSNTSITVTIPTHAVTGPNKLINITNAAGSGTFKLTIT
jgi:hypothetical protein